MNKPKHTPGPWSVGDSTGRMNQVAIEPTIGCVYGAGDEVKANARLTAAAPELLDAVNAVYINAVKLPDLRDEFSINRATLDKIKAAISKATGEAA